jgi:hypothetical protein
MQNRLVALIVFLAIQFLAIQPSLAATGRPAEIPFAISPDGMMTISATLGTVPAQVIFDTGAGIDVLAPSIVEKLHGTPAGQFTAFRMWGDRLDIPLFIVPEISVGPMIRRNVLVGTWEMLDQLHLEGIISVNDFSDQRITLDFVNKVMVFENAKSLARRRSSGATAPLKLDDNRGIALDLFSDFSIGNQTGDCEIDTGSQNATVNTRYMTPLGIDKDGRDVQKREQKTPSGASTVRYKTTLPKIALTAAPEIAITHAPTTFADIIYDCVIGLDFWSDKVVTIDIPGHQLIVSTSSAAKDLSPGK